MANAFLKKLFGDSSTRELKKLLRQVNVALVDHLIIVDGDMVSMAQSGYLELTDR